MMETIPYNPANWHWQLMDGRVWSSAAGAWITGTPTTPVTSIATVEELDWVLRAAGQRSPLVTAADVDAERDRRVAAGFTFGGHGFQSGSGDRENIAGASTAALAAIVHGAAAGDLRWHGGDSDFCWIAADNTLVPMDAQTMFGLGQAAMAHKQQLIFAARALKDMEIVPADYVDDGWWPSAQEGN